jgi:hypothetical protein
MSQKTKLWWKSAGVRATKTVAETAFSMLTVGQSMMEVDWCNVASVSLVAGIISLLFSLKGLPEVDVDAYIEEE